MREGGPRIKAVGTWKAKASEPPHDAGGGAVVVLVSARVIGMHVVALHTPGKTLEPELVVDASADVD